MNQQVLKFLKEYSYDTLDVNRLLVSSFLQVNGIHTVKNQFINGLRITSTDEVEFDSLQEFIKLISDKTYDLEALIEFFEFVISPADKEINGAVYTPFYIRNNIVSQCLTKRQELGGSPDQYLFADIACGCGGFFITIIKKLKTLTTKSYSDIFKQNIFGLDIQEYSIIRTKILLCLTAIINKEDKKEFKFNLYKGDALSFDWTQVPAINKMGGFDIIVGNPPYVGVTKMNTITKQLLKKWSVSLTGKPDLYIPFFEIGIKSLNKRGVLGYITVNTFFKSLNGRLLRSYFSSNGFDLSVIDFGGEQVFRNRSTYTCICIVRILSTNSISYLKSTSQHIDYIIPEDFSIIPYETLDDFNGWHLTDGRRSKIICKIENSGIALGAAYTIRNGFATLKNSIFVFKPIRETKRYYFLVRNGVEYKIERDICRNAIKPNTLKSEAELSKKIEQLIFPYVVSKKYNDLFGKESSSLKILDEKILANRYPNAYEYLSSHKTILSKRDKGNKEYEKWYAFGRNQALTISGYKLLFPYISDKPCFVFTEDENLLFYNGYAIISDSKRKLLVLQKILMSKLFWFYIENTSKPYSGNFFSIAKNYIKNFSICDLTKDEEDAILNLSNGDLDKFLEEKYDLVI